MEMKKEKIQKKIKKLLAVIYKNNLLEVIFILLNLINALLLRINTVNNGLRYSPFIIDLSFLLIITLLAQKIKIKKRIYYYMAMTILFTIICIVNSIYYHYYSSYASFSIIANISFASDVKDAIFKNVLRVPDLIYIAAPIILYLSYYYLKKKNKLAKEISAKKNKLNKSVLITILILLISGALTMPLSSWNRLYKLWNRESVVMNYGIYIYQLDDFFQSLTPKINSIFGHDKSLKKVTDYYKEHPYKKTTNEYTDIFKGKNVIVIHAESMQTFPMSLKFNGKEVTPNLNKLAKEGIFFNNFYAEVGVGTSSDSEFTFNTSLMPSTKGTAFVNYFDREYVAIPNLLKDKGYYTFSMHANTGDFWNRNNMYKALGYDDFYSKESYVIDETIGLGLSDKSFFRQSVEKIEKIKETNDSPFYGLLIMLSNHTPFDDVDLMEEFDTTISVDTGYSTITRDYLEGTTMNNYLRSVHYADSAIGEFIKELNKKKLLDNTVLIIYGDHDARLSYNDFNLLYNYDAIENKIRTKENDKYKPYNKYDYELDRKVPLIIWTKDKKYNIEVDTPTGMIDVLPTIGNMLGIHSDYQIGHDIFSLKDKDNTVVFVDGSFLTSKVYYNAPKAEIYDIIKEGVGEEYIKERADYATEIIEVSNDIISYNLIKELKSGINKSN